MTSYNVVNPSLLVDGEAEDISQVLANFNAIAAVLNGSLDNANIANAAAIAASKLAAGSSDQILKTVGGVPTWFGSFSTYTPVWTASGTAPNIGNGTASGRWLQIGKLVVATAGLVFGSTTTFGTGSYYLSLPVTSAALPLAGGLSGLIQDSSPVALYQAFAVWVDTGRMGAFTDSGLAVGAVVPITFANGDSIRYTIAYEAA
jgi:hypothetical protein